jgi:raffinose/stachyose/melibiose transport system permease protein
MSAITPRRRLSGIGRRREASLAPNYLILGILVVFSLGPIVILAFNSLKSRAEIGRDSLGLPRTFQWENFTRAWDVGNFSTTVRNSGILVALTLVGVLVLGGMAFLQPC